MSFNHQSYSQMTTPPNTVTFNTVLASMLAAAVAAQAPSVLRQIAASAMAVFRKMQVQLTRLPLPPAHCPQL